ncbi:MAG: hypothetical protein U5L02_08915 [Rheinheimera sp.]|nr:hypothetical protein [Rheinheimera sp.]
MLEYQKQFYALEQHNLIAVAAERLQRFDATVVIVSKAKSKPELMRQLLNIASIQYVTQRSAAATPAWHQAVADDYAIEQLFSMRQWSEIIDRHRSAVYRRKPKLQKKKSITTVDIQRVLKSYPLRQRGWQMKLDEFSSFFRCQKSFLFLNLPRGSNAFCITKSMSHRSLDSSFCKLRR